MIVFAMLIAGISVSISFKIKSNLELDFTLSGEDIMELMAPSMLADITGGCGDCNSFYVQHLNHTLK